MMVTITFFSALVCLVIWIPIKSIAGILVFVSIFGFASGGFIGICTTLVAQISDISQIGTRVGTLFAIESVGALIGSPIGGAIVAAQQGDFLGLQLFCGCSMIIGSILFVCARYTQVGFKLVKV
jgi:MFS family permease